MRKSAQGMARGIALLVVALLGSAAASAATHDVNVVNFAFSPRNLSIEAGDTVRWTNQGGVHNVVADDGSFGNDLSGAGWIFEVTFNQAGDFPYFCEAHGGPDGSGMSGQISVQGAPPPPPPPPPPAFTINEGVAGSWFNPATTGQGILLEASEGLGVLALAWFTWTGEGGYDWLTGAGGFEGDTATITLNRSTGGRFNDPAPVQTVPIGTATLTFSDCSNATFTFQLQDPVANGVIPLQRILPPNASCLEANPP